MPNEAEASLIAAIRVAVDGLVPDGATVTVTASNPDIGINLDEQHVVV